MHVLSSPIHSLRLRRARIKQKRTALHLLSLSGAIRPSHVEIRYTTPIDSITAFRTEPTVIERLQTQPIPIQPRKHNITGSMNTTWHRVRSLSSALVQLANKPIVLQWSKQVDL